MSSRDADFWLSLIRIFGSYDRATRDDNESWWLIVALILLIISIILSLIIWAHKSRDDSYIELKRFAENGRIRTSLGLLKEFMEPSEVREILGEFYHLDSIDGEEFYQTTSCIKIFDLMFDCIVTFKKDRLESVSFLPTDAMVEEFAFEEKGMTLLSRKMQELYERLTHGKGKAINENRWHKELKYSQCYLNGRDKNKPLLYIGFSHPE